MMFLERPCGSGETAVRVAVEEADSVFLHYGSTHPLCRNFELMIMVVSDS